MSDSRISKRYAGALFSLGQEDGSFATYGKELEEFKDFFIKNADFGDAISNPIYKLEERKNVLEFVLGKSSFSNLVKNFLNLLLDKKRIDSIEAIADKYAVLTDEASNIAHAEIITARPLQDDTLQKVIDSLKAMTSKDIKSEVTEDPELIGGIVVKMGDLVLDGSVKAQLEGLKESFKRGE
ncbi:MAG: ATP synthase F1 subunit delta [Desulfobacteraceae bacterium]